MKAEQIAAVSREERIKLGQTIATVTKGLQWQITVNDEKYNGVMPAQNLSDEEVANVLTYVYNNWSNGGSLVTSMQVASTR